MVAAAIELVFVARNAVVKSHFARKSAFRQQLQRAVHRGEPDLWVFLAREAEELIGGKMVACFQKGAQDGVALVSMLQAYTFQVFVKDVLRLAHGFASGRRMIVNSSLQHGCWMA